jgi:drug/metabolite transporter (DMT)-like permease
MMLGYVVWRDIPNIVAICGVALVVGSGLALMRREWARARRPELLADPNI